MTIIRNIYNNNYTVVPNSMANDESISWRARGMLLYIITKPESWNINTRDLVNKGDLGRDGVLSVLKELKEAGYIRLKQIREKGRIVRNEYICSAEPVFLKDSPGAAKPTQVEPTSVEPAHYKVQSYRKYLKEESNDSCSLSSSLRSSDKDSVHPTDEPSEKEILKPKKRVKREEYPPEFEVLWYHYPDRQKCPNPKKDAYLKCKSRLKEGTTWEEMMLALSAYDEYVTEEDIGPEYIKQGRTFFGGGGHIEEWLEKVDKEEANTILLQYRLYVAKVKAGESIEPIFPGDWEKYGIDRNEDYDD